MTSIYKCLLWSSTALGRGLQYVNDNKMQTCAREWSKIQLICSIDCILWNRKASLLAEINFWQCVSGKRALLDRSTYSHSHPFKCDMSIKPKMIWDMSNTIFPQFWIFDHSDDSLSRWSYEKTLFSFIVIFYD